MKQHFKEIAARQVAAFNHLADTIASCCDISSGAADLVARYYLKNKLAKLDNVHGTSMVKHGAFLDSDVIHRAVAACGAYDGPDARVMGNATFR